jgi:hypothetical protein
MAETTETTATGAQTETQQQAPVTGDATGTNGGEQQTTGQQQPVGDKTYTQADIDRIIGDRLAKERAKQETQAKKTQEEADRKAAEQQGQYEKLYKETQAKLEAAEAKARIAEHRELQRQAAEKVGLPAAFASRLLGESPEDLEADAKTLLASLPKPQAPNLNNEAGAGGRPANSQMSDADRANLAAELNVNPKYLNL